LHDRGCSEHDAAIAQLAQESSCAGSSYGHFTLGKMYRNGLAGFEQNLVKCATHYRAAAALGLAEAQFVLGLMYQQGLIAQPGLSDHSSYEEALRLYQMAAAQGQPSAMHAIGTLYELGRGLQTNSAEAIRWFWRAHVAGDSSALDSLQRYRPYLSAFGLKL
jgi:TPR repeat protein